MATDAGTTTGTTRATPLVDAGAAESGAVGLGVRDVVVRYGSTRRDPGTVAVDGVDLTVAPGEVLALLGPSGCGKSSLLRAVAGLEPLASGTVTWDGQTVAGVPVHRRGFGLMFQDGQLFAHRDVAGNVAYGLAGAPRDQVSARVDELLALAGLAGYGRRAIATLSGGERQRVALARALAPRPRLLLLDEPLSALDRALRERLALDLRSALVATGTTALFVTHDQDEAFAVADRVAVMADGRLLQVAAPAELWRAPASREVARFLGYEAFVPAGSAPRELLVAAEDLVGGPRHAVLALAEGAYVVVGLDSGRASATGTVRGVASRRGRAEVRVLVDGVGEVTALARAGSAWEAGERVPLRVDADALAVLIEQPTSAPPQPPASGSGGGAAGGD